MKRVTILAAAVFAVGATAFVLGDDEGGRRFREFLNGFKEATVVVSTTGNGTFRAEISRDGEKIEYTLTFQDLEGDVRQAHIHIGHPQNQGGIVLWLCDTATNPSPTANTPDCTENDPLDLRNGRVSGELTAADVQAQAANGIAAGEWEEVLGLIRAGRTYANVHSAKFPPGEIRSQLDNRDDDDRSGSGHGGH
jgi:hypothetical protein